MTAVAQPQPPRPPQKQPLKPQPVATTQMVQPAKPKAIPITSKISSVEEASKWKKILLYGDPGVGKTVLAAQMPRPLFVDVEKGTVSLLNHPELASLAKVLPIKDWNDLDDLLSAVIAGELPDIDTIIIDSVSELQMRNLDQIMDGVSARDKNRSRYLPLQGEYKENTSYMRQMVTQFMELEKHLVCTAHAVEVKDESTGVLMTRPAVTPKLSETFEGFFDVYGHLTMDVDEKKGVNGGVTIKRTLQVHPTRRVKAKTRLGPLPVYIENPTMDLLLNTRRVDEGQKGEQ